MRLATIIITTIIVGTSYGVFSMEKNENKRNRRNCLSCIEDRRKCDNNTPCNFCNKDKKKRCIRLSDVGFIIKGTNIKSTNYETCREKIEIHQDTYDNLKKDGFDAFLKNSSIAQSDVPTKNIDQALLYVCSTMFIMDQGQFNTLNENRVLDDALAQNKLGIQFIYNNQQQPTDNPQEMPPIKNEKTSDNSETQTDALQEQFVEWVWPGSESGADFFTPTDTTFKSPFN